MAQGEIFHHHAANAQASVRAGQGEIAGAIGVAGAGVGNRRSSLGCAQDIGRQRGGRGGQKG